MPTGGLLSSVFFDVDSAMNIRYFPLESSLMGMHLAINKIDRLRKGNFMRTLIVTTIICLFAAASFAAESGTTSNCSQETITTKSGLRYTCLSEGTGRSPGPEDTVRVNYRGTLVNGREFDSSYKNGGPTEFKLNSVIKCWTEGLQMMKVGGKAKLVCPSNLAYGEEGIVGSIPRYAELRFEVELVEIE